MSAPQVYQSDIELKLRTADPVRRLGVIALATDLTSERDFARIIPGESAGLHVTRVQFDNPTTPENLHRMAPRLTAAADLILPGIALDAICYSCTAASVVIGDDAILKAIHAARPGVPVVTPTGAALLAMKALGVSRLAVLTPYLVETSVPMATYFAGHGLDIIRFECFGIDDDRVMAQVSKGTIVEAALQLDDPQAEAFFISCTALPAVDAIDEIESRTGKPVITSNQACAWAMMRHARLDDRPTGFGKLFDFDLPTSERGFAA